MKLPERQGRALAVVQAHMRRRAELDLPRVPDPLRSESLREWLVVQFLLWPAPWLDELADTLLGTHRRCRSLRGARRRLEFALETEIGIVFKPRLRARRLNPKEKTMTSKKSKPKRKASARKAAPKKKKAAAKRKAAPRKKPAAAPAATPAEGGETQV